MHIPVLLNWFLTKLFWHGVVRLGWGFKPYRLTSESFGTIVRHNLYIPLGNLGSNFGIIKVIMNKFHKDLDEVLLVQSVLKRLGSGKVNSFSERLRTQKTHYLAQACGIVPAYSYNLYLRGPYSPSLADDLIKIDKEDLVTDTSKFIPDELNKRFQTLKQAIKGKSSRDLEIAITLHWFLKEVGLKKDSAISNTAKYKHATEEEINNSFVLINTLAI